MIYGILFGIMFGSFIFEPIIINLVYFTNVALFCDIILSKKNKLKLQEYFNNKKEKI